MGRSQVKDRQWQPHPARAAALRALAFGLPLVVSVIVGIVVGALMPAPDSTASLVLWWGAVLGSSTLAVYAADRVTRKVLPLATLMRLSILFPDRAPSRLKVARKVSGSRAIATELAKAGMATDRQEAAETILALVGALGDYDARTRGHSERTQLFVTMLADELKLSSEDKGKLMWAALVHDIGKLKVPHEVLNKPAKPTEEEWELLHSHPHHGAEICEPLREWLGPWWLAIEQHHEKYDGSGYPHALAGREISYGARIVAVADSYEVMTAARPYKRPMTAQAARTELTACAGSHFDPEIVRAFLNISLGGVRRSTGPLAWLAQIFMVRPGPILGQVMGASAGAVGAAATVIGLNMAPGIAHAEPTTTAQQKPPATAPPLTSPTPDSQTPDPQTPAPTPTATTSPRPATPPLTSAPGRFAVVDDVESTVEDTARVYDVLANDAMGGVVEIAGVTDPTRGASMVVGNKVLFTPDQDVNGIETFYYTVRDTFGRQRTGLVTVDVVPVNDRPVAGDDALVVDEDVVSAPLRLLGNDTDVDGDTLTVTAVTGATNGTVTQRAGDFVYTPDRDYSGAETLQYTISDGNGGASSATASLTVAPVNDAPVARPDTASMAEDSGTMTLANLLTNDTDVENDPLTVTAVTGAAHGTIAQPTSGVFTYRPGPNFHGVETLSYTVSDGHGGTDSSTVRVTVTPVNDQPSANDDAIVAAEDAVDVPLQLLANDTDIDGDALTVTSVSPPVHGTVQQVAGSWTYTPDPNWNGVETLSYAISDGNGGTASATVTITVTAVNDSPVAGADTSTIAEDSGPAALDLVTNDTDADGDSLTVTGVTGAANGAITSPGGVWTYTPALNYAGVETLDYTVDDGNGGTDTGTMTVTVTPVQDPPVANDDSISLLEDAIDAPLDLLGNDVDVDGDTLTVTAVTGAVNGTLTEQSPGVWTYTPDDDWSGTETLSYDVSDGNGGADTATVTVTVTAVNDAPVAGPDAYAITAGQTLTTTAADGVLSNDGDADGDTLTVTGDDSLLIDINADGSFTYLGLLPATEVATYTVSDGNGGTATGTLTITVTVLASSTVDLYLQPVDTVSMGSLTTTPPSTGIGDYDADGSPGLTIDPSSMKPDETDPQKFQEWSYPVPTGGLTMNGPITMDLWTSLKDEADKDLDYAAWVYDCGPAGCALLASTVGVHIDNWSTTTTWERRTVTVGSANTTIPAGHTVKVRLAFNHTDVWLPLSSTYPSSLSYTR